MIQRTVPRRRTTRPRRAASVHLPPVAEVLNAFRFLPDWRLDDVMISFAAPGGSVGPHVDAYDVFLLQAEGPRQWSLDPSPVNRTLRAAAPLRLLEHFAPTETHELAPGDLNALRSLLALEWSARKWQACRVLLHRILECAPGDREARGWLQQLRQEEGGSERQ